MIGPTPKLKPKYHKADFDQRVKYDRWMYLALILGMILMIICYDGCYA